LRPGEQLKELRNRLEISTREVEEHSRRIAELENNEEYYVSNAWLTQIENKVATPSIYKLYSLSVIYRTSFTDLLMLYGVDLKRLGSDAVISRAPRGTAAKVEIFPAEKPIAFPARFDPAFKPDRTNVISRMVDVWGELPLGVLQQMDFKQTLYGYVGMEDYTLYPLIRPGSFVLIDDRQKRIQRFPWRTEFDRPIYFVELRDGYACAWCELQGSQITLLPHPLSQCSLRQYEYPSEAEVLGRVVGVAMRIVNYADPPGSDAPQLPNKLGEK
jgi:transcriptional regulator with XRE-family HTH domain